jgi:hypothetical protein
VRKHNPHYPPSANFPTSQALTYNMTILWIRYMASLPLSVNVLNQVSLTPSPHALPMGPRSNVAFGVPAFLTTIQNRASFLDMCYHCYADAVRGDPSNQSSDCVPNVFLIALL